MDLGLGFDRTLCRSTTAELQHQLTVAEYVNCARVAEAKTGWALMSKRSLRRSNQKELKASLTRNVCQRACWLGVQPISSTFFYSAHRNLRGTTSTAMEDSDKLRICSRNYEWFCTRDFAWQHSHWVIFPILSVVESD